MGRRWRWVAVAALVLGLCALPPALGVVPVPGTSPSASELLERASAASGAAYEGYAESTGYLALPVSDEFASVATLLGGRTQLRAWWRTDTDWRVDTLSPFGENSQRSGPDGSWLWDFEDDRATRVGPEPERTVRLPGARDALPPQLAARVLSGARADTVTDLPSRRVAGRAADGLRLRPREPDSSISTVDVWLDRESGIPVTVELYATGADRPALSTTFLDFAPVTPQASTTQFTVPPGARVRDRQRLDLVGAIGRFAQVEPPRELIGYPRQPPLPGAGGVAVYGDGLTQFAVAPLPGRTARSLRGQLDAAAGVTALPEGQSTAVGPVGLLLSDPAVTGGREWLVVGTLTPEGLARAARELASPDLVGAS